MEQIVNQALQAYPPILEMNPVALAQSRERITRYITTLASTGRTDPHELEEYARAYLRELCEGPDFRFTGC